MNYSRILRVIGQRLEPLQPERYEIVCYGSSYLVRCRVKDTGHGGRGAEKRIRGFKAFLRLWREEEPLAGSSGPNEQTSMNVEFLFSLDDLMRQEEERKQPRSGGDRMSDPHSLSNTLRIVGWLLDRKPDAKLLFASSRGEEVVLLYETKPDVRTLENYPIPVLYDYWVKQYVKRKK